MVLVEDLNPQPSGAGIAQREGSASAAAVAELVAAVAQTYHAAAFLVQETGTEDFPSRLWMAL